jgi:hypothetical protein
VSASGEGFAIDRTGVALIVSIALVITPATMLATAWMLSEGVDFAAASTFDLVGAALCCLLALYVIRATVRELAGALRVRIDERGVARGSVELAWSEVETLAAPKFGLLELAGNGKRLLLRTYLYDDRTKLLEFIARQTGKPVPELTNSY